MSEGSWTPKSWGEAIPYIVWGILAFAFGFEGVAALIHGEWWPAIFGLGGMFGLVAMLIHWARVRQAFSDVRWLIAAMMVALIVVALSPYFGRQQWSFLTDDPIKGLAVAALLLVIGAAFGNILRPFGPINLSVVGRRPDNGIPVLEVLAIHTCHIEANVDALPSDLYFDIHLTAHNGERIAIAHNSIKGIVNFDDFSISPPITPVLIANGQATRFMAGYQFGFTLRVHMPKSAAEKLHASIAEGKIVGIGLQSLIVSVSKVGDLSGATYRLPLWDGITVSRSTRTGRKVALGGTIQIAARIGDDFA